jgi:cytochrome c5
MRLVISAALAAAVGLMSMSAYAETGRVSTSTSADFPNERTKFTGSGSEVVNTNCATCHSADIVLRQPPRSRIAWLSVVRKMVRFYKAPVDENDVDAILDYLMHVKGEN